MLTGAEGAEVLGRLGDGVPEEAEDDPPSLAAFDVHVEEDLVGDLFGVAACDGGERKLVRLQIIQRRQEKIPSASCKAILQSVRRATSPLRPQRIPPNAQDIRAALTRWQLSRG